MTYENVYDLVKGEAMLQLTRLGDDGKEWDLSIQNDSVGESTGITLDRKNMKDLIDALEAERYGPSKSVGV